MPIFGGVSFTMIAISIGICMIYTRVPLIVSYEWAEQEIVYLFYQLLKLLFLSDDPSPRTKITKITKMA